MIEADAEVSLFVRDQATGRLVFNSRAIKAAELAQRGYPLDGEVASPAVAPEHEPVNVSAKDTPNNN